LYLFDSQQGFVEYSVNTGNADENIIKNLRAGTYYAYVSNGGNGTNYKLEASAVSLGAVPADNAGNTFDTAKNLGILGTTAVVANDFVGDFNGLSTDDIDYYQFTITENSTVNLKLSGLSQNADLYLFDSQQGFVEYSVNAGNADENVTKNLRAGTYYAYVSSGGNATNYKFEVSAVSLDNTPIDNNPINQASDLGILGSVAKTIDDQVGNSAPDYYKFVLTENSTVNIKLSGLSQDASLQLFSDTETNLNNSFQPGNTDENI
ncbi:MAG: PPC domain-containing protein, partial [Aphanizomenon gracile PMC649.10]|nr:PPC domain-containing protein [Aphanizomenon gracile PMC649.10]